jgi:hypothetical protein
VCVSTSFRRIPPRASKYFRSAVSSQSVVFLWWHKTSFPLHSPLQIRPVMSDDAEKQFNPNLGFEREVSENTVSYLLLVLDGSQDSRQLLRQLEGVRQAAMQLCRDLTENYIWQRDAFDLELRTEGGKCPGNYYDMSIELTMPQRTGLPLWGHRLWRRHRRRVAHCLHSEADHCVEFSCLGPSV